ncbi:MAG TPA: ice-binding family protein [Bacteroidia bacterium]|nr:ice-binding family protein [Bacteroidia bacterium]
MIKLISKISAVALFLIPMLLQAQAPSLGSAANFALFTTAGAVTNSGISQVTGNVGSNNGSSTGFGNVNGGMHDMDGVSAQCAADVLIAYNQLNAAIPTGSLAPLLGNGDTLTEGIYAVSGAATIGGSLTLDAQNDPNAVFILQIQGSLSAAAGTRVVMANGGLACNVFWKVEGLVSVAAGSVMRGTIIANNAAIELNTNDTLEGRALSTTGAVIIDGALVYTPIGCGSPVLNGPIAPTLNSVECYAIFSADGSVTNSGITTVNGDVGSNTGLTSGFDSLLVNGTIHPLPDGSTAACAADLQLVYQYLNLMPSDIELLYPAQFGRNLVLTPHAYLLDAATTLTDSVYLNGLGNPDAVFVLQINGAFEASANSRVLLINGTKAENVYWKVEGAANIHNYSIFNGMLLCNNGALAAFNTGVEVNGRLLTTAGALATTAIASLPLINPANCSTVAIAETLPTNAAASIRIHPNPFAVHAELVVSHPGIGLGAELRMYNLMGMELLRIDLNDESTRIPTDRISAGMYAYKIIQQDQVLKSGRLIAQ